MIPVKTPAPEPSRAALTSVPGLRQGLVASDMNFSFWKQHSPPQTTKPAMKFETALSYYQSRFLKIPVAMGCGSLDIYTTIK
jgi:hypothetical protein